MHHSEPARLSRRRALAGLGGLAAAGFVERPTPQAIAQSESSTPSALAASIGEAATTFLASLDEPGLARATYAFTDPERQRWHWTVPANVPRNGLPLNVMSEVQRESALALLRSSLSEAGYRKDLDIMSLQRDLGNDPEDYYVSVFGTPGTEPWGWRFEGHHLSRHITVAGDRVVTTPFFLGAWPTINDAGLQAMERRKRPLASWSAPSSTPAAPTSCSRPHR